MICKIFRFLIWAVSYAIPFIIICSAYIYCLRRFGFEETVVVALANITALICFCYERR